MRRIRKIESPIGRALSYVGGFLLISVFVLIPLIFLNSNLVWGEANQYGRVPIPGHKGRPPAVRIGRSDGRRRCPGAATRPLTAAAGTDPDDEGERRPGSADGRTRHRHLGQRQ
jgi:hypothetical protein